MNFRWSILSLAKKAESVPKLAGHGLIKAYQYVLAPLIGPRCRHLPSCSQYADEAVGRFGLWAGSWMALARICRCHPFGTSGLDFVPQNAPPSARWFLPWRYGRWRGTNSQGRDQGHDGHTHSGG